MFLKKIIKIIIFTICIFLIVVLSFYIYIEKNNIIENKIKNGNKVSFIILLYDIGNLFPKKLETYVVLYERSSNILKILSINTDVIVDFVKNRGKSLKMLFYENSKKNLDYAIERFYLDLYKIIGNTAKVDFYLNVNFKKLKPIILNDKKLRDFILNDNFKNRDLKSLTHLEIIEYISKFAIYKVLNIYKQYGLLDINISKKSLFSLFLRFKFFKPVIMFCELPVKYTDLTVELDKRNTEEFLNKVYNVSMNSKKSNNDVIIDIKNASKKSRMAEKIGWILRENKFDVLDWTNFNVSYYKTLIKDNKGNFYQSLRIANILKTGKIIVSYNSNIYSDITIFVGKDCIIYDDFDKKKKDKN
ncbi:MAG: LytR C-terminal domain-containing protein [Endomicrobium sp.]|nr:LytR C-terminal domain-containing protein [Endomicrobium sp.]